MNRLLKAVFAVVCLIGLASASHAQTTTITASNLKMAGAPITVGTVSFTPVNTIGVPIAFADGTGAQNSPTAYECAITAGAITGSIQPDGTTSGTCAVPDATETIPANILYSIQVVNTSTGLSTSGKSYTLQAVVGVSGTTWALDHYGPPASTSNVQTIVSASGSTVPSSCQGAAFYTYTAIPAFPILNTCVGGVFVPIVGSVPSRALTGEGSVIYEGSNYTNTSMLAAFNVGGTAPTVSAAGAIVFNAPSGLFDAQSLELKNVYTADEALDIDITFTIDTITSTSNGLLIGQHSQAPGGIGTSVLAHFFSNTYGGGLTGFHYWQGATDEVTPVSLFTGTPNFTPVAGDLMRFQYSHRPNTISVILTDVTQGITYTPSITTVQSTAKTFETPASSTVRISSLGGQFSIYSIKVTSAQALYMNAAVLGDSKCEGKDALSYQNRWTSLISSLGPIGNFCGGGDRTVELVQGVPYLLSFHPRYLLLSMGRNDLATSVPSATWQANYLSAVNQAKAAGVTVIHLLPIPETAQDQTALRAWILATFPNDAKIDPSVGWLSSYLDADQIHPNVAGHAFIANLIRNSGLITPIPGAPSFHYLAPQ